MPSPRELDISGSEVAVEARGRQRSQGRFARRTQQIARVTDLPVLVDADTGFGEPMNVARTVQALEDAGAAGCHVEDQVNPKRCGHLDGKSVVEVQEMTWRIAAAVRARRDE